MDSSFWSSGKLVNTCLNCEHSFRIGLAEPNAFYSTAESNAFCSLDCKTCYALSKDKRGAEAAIQTEKSNHQLIHEFQLQITDEELDALNLNSPPPSTPTPTVHDHISIHKAHKPKKKPLQEPLSPTIHDQISIHKAHKPKKMPPQELLSSQWSPWHRNSHLAASKRPQYGLF